MPLAPELILELQKHLADRPEEGLAFQVPRYAYRALKKDLLAAGIEYEVNAKFADFHCLRHTFVTRIVNSGVKIKTARALARHSDPRLTLGKYTHIEFTEQEQAIQSLPSLFAEGGEKRLNKTTDLYDSKRVGTYVGS